MCEEPFMFIWVNYKPRERERVRERERAEGEREREKERERERERERENWYKVQQMVNASIDQCANLVGNVTGQQNMCALFFNQTSCFLTGQLKCKIENWHWTAGPYRRSKSCRSDRKFTVEIVRRIGVYFGSWLQYILAAYSNIISHHDGKTARKKNPNYP